MKTDAMDAAISELPPIADFDEIPIIDFTDMASPELARREAVALQLRDACTRVGFFYLRNHGVEPSLIAAMFGVAKSFFALPEAVKLRSHLSKSAHHRGFTSLQEGRAENSNPHGDLHEAFHCSLDVPESDPEILRGHFLLGPNLWPEQPPDFRPVVESYYSAMLQLGRRIYAAFALALDLPEDFFAAMIRRPGSFMTMNHYPPQQAQHGDDQFGISPHSDYECFTILLQDSVGGLEIRNRRGEWVPAPPIEGCYVINIADMMARWTNDRFASTLHRVVNRSGRERYSIPFFYGVDYDTTISVLPSCVSPENPARYGAVGAHDYVAGRLRGSYTEIYAAKEAMAGVSA